MSAPVPAFGHPPLGACAAAAQPAGARHGGRAERYVRQPAAGAAAAGASRRSRPGRPHPASDGAAQSQQHARGRAGSVLRGVRGGAGEAAGGRALPSRHRAAAAALLPAGFPLSQACFASLVSQDYVNGTDQEEIRTGEAPGRYRGGAARPGLTQAQGAPGPCSAGLRR